MMMMNWHPMLLILPWLFLLGVLDGTQATTPSSSSRQLIINGHDALPHRFPYYTSLDYHNGVVLSGALIAPDFILTAGHCLENDNDKVTVRVNTYSLLNHTNTNATTTTTNDDEEQVVQPPEIVKIQQAIRHPLFHEFQPECFTHDFLLFHLQAPVKSITTFVKVNRNPNIPKPVSYHYNNNDDDDEDDPNAIIMMGLGWTSKFYSSPAFTLQQAALFPISNEACAKQSHDPNYGMTYQGILDQTMLCTKGGLNNTRDGCAWDSGDPVILPGKHPQDDIVVGLGSWGFGCADPNFPGVQARVSAAADWIDEMVCQYSVDPPADFHCSNKKQQQTTISAVNTTKKPKTTTKPTIQPTTAPTIRKVITTTAPSIAPIQTELPSQQEIIVNVSDVEEPSTSETGNNTTAKSNKSSSLSLLWRIFICIIACAIVIQVAAFLIHRQRQQRTKFNDKSDMEVEGLLFHNNRILRSDQQDPVGYGSTAMQQ